MFSHTAISGSPKNGIYSQTLISGNFFIVLSLSGADLELGHNTIAKIEEILDQTPEITPKELVEIENFGNILVAKINTQKLSLAGSGEVAAKLYRQGKIINLFSGHPVSGTVYHQDLILLSTKSFSYPISPTDSVTEIRDKLLPEIESQDDNANLAAIFVKVELQEEVKPVREIFLRRRPNMPSRKVLYLSLITLVFLISLIIFQLRSRVLEQQDKVVANITSQIQDGLDSAHKLAGLNDQLARDTLLQTRSNALASADKIFNKKYPAKLQKTFVNLDQEISAVSHVNQVANLDLFYDFSLLKANAKIISVSMHKDLVMVLDGNNGSIYSLNLSTKGAAIVAGNDALKSGKYIDFSPDDNFVLADGQIIFKKPIKSSDKWGKIADLKVFAGNIYLLDSTNNQIWKYQNTELGFTDISSYLRAGSVDFSNAQNMAIDGSVYVLTTTGKIAKFTSGLPENLQITGLDPALNNPVSLFTTDDVQNIYILDQGGKRVVVLTKKGAYQAQYNLPMAVNFVLADEALKKIFLLSGSKVYSLDQR